MVARVAVAYLRLRIELAAHHVFAARSLALNEADTMVGGIGKEILSPARRISPVLSPPLRRTLSIEVVHIKPFSLHLAQLPCKIGSDNLV